MIYRHVKAQYCLETKKLEKSLRYSIMSGQTMKVCPTPGD